MTDAARSNNVQTAPRLKKTLGLFGLTVNAMAFIAPGAFLWLTIQAQVAQTDPTGVTTAPDIWFGLLVALVLSFLTAASYAWLARRYPGAGAGSSYYYAQRALLDKGYSNRAARDAKFGVGWLSHLYYWVYPGVMVAFMAILISFIIQAFGFVITPFEQISIAVVFSLIVGFIAYRGIQGSTRTNLIVNIIQLAMVFAISVMALIYRFVNPEQLTFTFSNVGDILVPHDAGHVLFQAAISILVLVGFESISALSSEAKNPKDIPRAVVLSLVIQGIIAYLFGYFAVQGWFNSKYSFSQAAVSGAPLGDMVRILGDVFFAGNGFVLMLIAATAVAAAVLGTTLACLNTGVRVTYAISRDTEAPEPLGKLNPRFGTPALGVWVLTAVSAAIGSFGVLSLRNLTAVVFLSNFGTFLLYGTTCIITIIALSKERRSIVSRYVIPIGGFTANLVLLGAVAWLAFIGGSDTRWAASFAIAVTVMWMAIGLGYFIVNSKSRESRIFPFPGKEAPEDRGMKYSIVKESD